MAKLISITRELSDGTQETFWSETYIMKFLGSNKGEKNER